MQLVIIDNHDSFTFNLVELCRLIGVQEVKVMKNDQLDNLALKGADKILISPGPGLPSETPNLLQIIDEFAPRASILGICLGFQAIIKAFGGSLKQLDSVQHGIVSYVSVREDAKIFNGIDSPFPVGRYHSWIANQIPDSLEITAWSEGNIMGVRHKEFDVQGVQFHPESFLTPSGKQIVGNWLNSSAISGEL